MDFSGQKSLKWQWSDWMQELISWYCFLSRILQTFVAGRFQHRHDCHRDDADCQQSRVKKKKMERKNLDTRSLCYWVKKNVIFFLVYWSDFLGVCVNCLLFHNLRGNKRRFADRDWCGIINPHRMMTSSFCTGLVSRGASSQCVRHSKWTSPKKMHKTKSYYCSTLISTLDI